jgi:hypothetical protein
MAKAAVKKKGKKSKKKGLPRSFYIIFGVMFVLPAIGLIAWYVMTVSLAVTGSEMSASELIASRVVKAREAMRDKMSERAIQEGFSLAKVDSCSGIEDQYLIPQGVVYTEFTTKQLLGLPKTATGSQIRERCILFAKIVARMEKLAHHDRHVFVCEGMYFAPDTSGNFLLYADKKRRGVVESFHGKKKLIPIPRGSHKLVHQWQVFNVGDGCIVIGLSKDGIFSMSGTVKLQ